MTDEDGDAAGSPERAPADTDDATASNGDETAAGTDGSLSVTAGDADDGAAGEEWQFDADDFGSAAEDGEQEDDGNVAGSLLDLDGDIEPGTPTLEGTVFVVLGALATLLLLLEAGGVV